MVDQEGKLEKAGEAVKLLKSERQDKILDILLVEKKIIASEMSVRLGVSEDTIRRDIYLLLPHGEFFLWLTLIIFWRIPFSFQQKSLICYLLSKPDSR